MLEWGEDCARKEGGEGMGMGMGIINPQIGMQPVFSAFRRSVWCNAYRLRVGRGGRR